MAKFIDPELLKHKRIIAIYGDLEQGLEEREVVYVEDIDNAPTIEAKPVVHAHWEYLGVSDGKKIYKCTNCKAHIHGRGNFCKECGAIMDEKEGE